MNCETLGSRNSKSNRGFAEQVARLVRRLSFAYFLGAALYLFGKFIGHAQKILNIHISSFFAFTTAMQNLGWPPSQNCHHQDYIFFGGGPKLNLHLATDILGEEGKSDVM